MGMQCDFLSEPHRCQILIIKQTSWKLYVLINDFVWYISGERMDLCYFNSECLYTLCRSMCKSSHSLSPQPGILPRRCSSVEFGLFEIQGQTSGSKKKGSWSVWCKFLRGGQRCGEDYCVIPHTDTDQFTMAKFFKSGKVRTSQHIHTPHPKWVGRPHTRQDRTGVMDGWMDPFMDSKPTLNPRAGEDARLVDICWAGNAHMWTCSNAWRKQGVHTPPETDTSTSIIAHIIS